MIVADGHGAACPAGGFVIDPLIPAANAVITHAHADHARPGSGTYWCAAPTAPLLRRRLGDVDVRPIPYGEPFRLGDVRVSFHPAGHVLGSAQVRLEAGGEVWGVSGDYKRDDDPTCAPFAPVRCDVFVTEATFGLPIYRWDPPAAVFADVWAWWSANRAAGRASVLLGYALGKAQRLLAGLAAHTDQPVYVHGAVEPLVRIYRDAGVAMLPTLPVADTTKGRSFAGQLVIAPPGWEATPWIRRFGDAAIGFASGWMRVRAMRRRRAIDRGFVLSDHADWPSLVRTVAETGARRVLVTHGHVAPLVRHLREAGVDAAPLAAGWEVEERPERADADGEVQPPAASPAGGQAR